MAERRGSVIFELNCAQCGKFVRTRRTPANTVKPPRFCSQQCNGAARRGTGSGPRPTHRFACKHCGKEVAAYRSPSQAERQPPKYCSVECIGAAQRLSDNPSFTGGRYVDSNGYVHVLAPDHPGADCRGYIYEHRLIAEKKIGRQLLSTEVVHHCNRQRSDNSPENLEVFASHVEHMRHHAEVRDAQ